MKNYIIESNSNFINKEVPLYNGDVNLFLYDDVDNIDIKKLGKFIVDIIPQKMFTVIDTIYVGSFDFLDEEGYSALYKDGAIFISNKQQESYSEILTDILHELAHSMEEKYSGEIYTKELVDEFVKKRIVLWNKLKSRYDIDKNLFLKVEPDDAFDDFLYNTVTYPKLRYFASGLFTSPYATTSIREYWACGIEEYFSGGYTVLQHLTPELFNVIQNIMGDF